MMRLQLTWHPPHKLLLHFHHNSLSHRTLPKVVPAPKGTPSHRATHTRAMLQVHALRGSKAIPHKAPKHLLDAIVPPQPPQRPPGGSNRIATCKDLRRVTPHGRGRNSINKVTGVLSTQLNQRAELQLSSYLDCETREGHNRAAQAPPQARNQPTVYTLLLQGRGTRGGNRRVTIRLKIRLQPARGSRRGGLGRRTPALGQS
jgi:hypothetical protein